MEVQCQSCANTWEATRLDPYILRCGFCGNLTCERCGRHDRARMHVCTSCYERKGSDLEDIFVGACSSCGWVRPVGAVGYGLYDKRNVCRYCVENGVPDQKPENDEAYTRESFQRRVRNYFPAVDNTDPGRDLLPLTMEKYHEWDRKIEFDIRDRCLAQAAFHRDAASVEGLLKLFEFDKYKLEEIAHALGRINQPKGNAFLLGHVKRINEEPYYAELAIAGLSESPGRFAFDAVILMMNQKHFSVTPMYGLEVLLKMEFLAPGFLFQPEFCAKLKAALELVPPANAHQHLVYFCEALPRLL
ncbi:MAG: hypothetical protein CVV41_16200 [Candidatus Riflebacteria bacterium HGW-Riflebacteria-1]|nr:MAG: hypothetical protein CVV41_16200 [Candidatus Riflebacteria bacterium HGW-Riflebacteria-1]